jgi:hypothetical protein
VTGAGHERWFRWAVVLFRAGAGASRPRRHRFAYG